MSEPDPTMSLIGQAIGLGHHGERDAARQLLTRLWEEMGGAAGDPLHRCALAHSMADLQDDVHDELAWDLRALDAAELISEERASQAGVAGTVAVFYPSLHLNAGDCYRRIGDLERARVHLDSGRAAMESLGDDGYALMIKDGLDRLAERLNDADSAGFDGAPAPRRA